MSGHALAQRQNVNTPQENVADTVSLQHRHTNQAEPTTLPKLLYDVAPGTFAEPRFGYDLSLVPAYTDMMKRTQPLLRTRPMVQRYPVSGDADSAPCSTCSDEESTPISASAEPTAEPTSPTPEVAPTPATPEPEEESAAPEETTTPALLVEDSATELAPGQMRKSEFLAQLRAEVTRAAEAAMAGTGRTTADCPYLDYWFDYYSAQDVQHCERALRRYAPEASSATSARDYIPIVVNRVRRSVETWVRTGEVTGVPEGVSASLSGEIPAESAPTASSPVMAKARDGRVRLADNPQAIQAELGNGRPLSSGVRSRMESAFGMDFSHVRTHTDTTAARLSSRLNARAFTIGKHVAFGAAEYRPGTLVGDALIAHELAHVVQQRGASTSVAPMQTGEAGYGTLENDADKSAMGVLASLWGGAKGKLADVAQNAIPRLRSGLSLQRCRDCGSSGSTTRTCVFPIAVENGPRHSAINTATHVGMEIDITIIASSGNPADLAGVEDSEQVSSSVDHTGCFSGLGSITGGTSGFQPATSIPPDRHMAPKASLIDCADNHGGNGSISFLQLDIFRHTACGVATPRVIPNSGYRIKHTITTGPGTRIMANTEKSAEACTVNSYTANAGPSPTYDEDNVVRS